MAYAITSKKTGISRAFTDEQYQNALALPGFNSLFKAEPILPPAKMVRKKSEVDAPEPETPNDEQAETSTAEQS